MTGNGRKKPGAVALLAAIALVLAPAGNAAANHRNSRGREMSETRRLGDRRYVASATRGYIVGTQSGRFPAMGFHTRGEMGGIWSPPMKLLDGIWFGIDDEWIRPATRFTSGYGYSEMKLPSPRRGLDISRVDFLPDGERAALFGLTFTAPNKRQRFTLNVEAHSELMKAYPWGETDPSQLDYNLADEARVLENGRVLFRERGTPPVPNAESHDGWRALVGSNMRPIGARTGPGFRGPQDPPVICPASGPDAPPAPPRCDDTEYGRGAGGRLRYRVTIERGQSRTVWIGVAGSERGTPAAQATLDRVLARPHALLERKIAKRSALARRTRLTILADRRLTRGIDWSKQNLADSVQIARDLEIRETNAGTNYPTPEGEVERVRFLGAGFPDYPWLFATDGEYTAFASVAVGQFGPIKDHLRALRDVSLIDNGGSGKVVHEVVTDGSVYFGSNADAGNTDETAKFPSAVALVWRWTGDDAFRDEMYEFAKSNMEYIFRELDDDNDNWPEGLGNVEREGMGEEKLDNTVYTIRGLRDLADMAESKGDVVTAAWAESKATEMEQAFDPAWWMPSVPQHADSLRNPDNEKVQQRHWIGATPMEVELVRNGEPVLGLTTRRRGKRALRLRETPCYTGTWGLFHTGGPGCDPAASDRPAEKTVFTLNTAIMAVAEGNYGRLRPGQQQYYLDANARLQLRPDEQPGAMPEIAPSPDYGRSINRPFNERAMVLQAWGAYGTVWPVVHQLLGVRPDLGRRRLEVVPQVPPQWPGLTGRNIRLGDGSIGVSASRRGHTYRTTVIENVSARLTIGHTIRRTAVVRSVTLDGAPVPHTERDTHRGIEVLVPAPGSGTHRLVVRTR